MKNSRQPTNKTGSGWNLAVPIRYVIDHPIKDGYTAVSPNGNGDFSS
jgi:hypothetical protein